MTVSTNSFQKIMDTAEALIQEKGCRQMTLQDIIRSSGLSKGAIYHYVSSKDELLGLVLKSRVEKANQRFNEAANDPNSSGLEKPLRAIAEGMARASSYENVTNKIFIYLLSQMDQPKVAELVEEIHDYTLRTCSSWIEAGKKAGFIPAESDSAKLAESLILFMYGMRTHSAATRRNNSITVEELVQFMRRTLS